MEKFDLAILVYDELINLDPKDDFNYKRKSIIYSYLY